MNLLAITLCVSIITVSIAKPKTQTRLLPSTTINYFKDAKFLPPDTSRPPFTTRSIITTYRPPTRSTTPKPTTLMYYQKRSRSLYNYNYNSDTGIQAQEEGHLNNVDTDREALEVRGNYNYTDNQDNTFHVSYIANENGFQPEGAHLPTVPPLINKAIQYIAEHSKENEKK